jgi:hypothetical protein
MIKINSDQRADQLFADAEQLFAHSYLQVN